MADNTELPVGFSFLGDIVFEPGDFLDTTASLLPTEGLVKAALSVTTLYPARGVDAPCRDLRDAPSTRPFEGGMPTVDTCNRWCSGAYLAETKASLLYLVERHGHDPEETLVREVDETKDNDTIASVVGAAVGALHGAVVLAKRWRGKLAEKTESDSGEELSLQSKYLSWLPTGMQT